MLFIAVRKTNLIAALFFVMTGLSLATQAYAGCGEIQPGIQKIIDEDRVKLKIPGLQVSVTCPGATAPFNLVSGTTTSDGNVRVQTDHLFQIGSVTKSFTAAIILQLEAEQRLTINDDIGKWLPKLPDEWKQITIRQLLNHTSGLEDYSASTAFQQIMLWNNGKIQWAPEELLKYVPNKLLFKPGTQYHYTNTNYVLAGMIINAVTGRSYEEEINSRLIRALNLNNTFYWPRAYDETLKKRLVHGYLDYESLGGARDVTDVNMSFANSAGALVSNTNDVNLWFEKLIKGSVLPPRQMDELMSLVDVTNAEPLPVSSKKEGYGLAVMHSTERFGMDGWYHPGQTMGYGTIMMWMKCLDIFVATTVNRFNGNPDAAAVTRDVVTYIQKTLDTGNQCISIPASSRPEFADEMKLIRMDR